MRTETIEETNNGSSPNISSPSLDGIPRFRTHVKERDQVSTGIELPTAYNDGQHQYLPKHKPETHEFPETA